MAPTTLRPVLQLGNLLFLALFALPLTGEPSYAESQGGATYAEQRPLPDRWHSRFLEEPVFGGRVFVVEAGDRQAPPVLLVHGLGQNGLRDWRRVIRALEDNYRVVALDLPGFGRSPTPSGALSPRRYTRLLFWLTRRLEMGKVHLVGHSMGAAIAIHLAANHPAKVKDLFVANVAGILQRTAFLSGIISPRDLTTNLPPILESGLQGLLGQSKRFLKRIIVTTDLDPTTVLRRSSTPWQTSLDRRPNINAAISLLETNFSAEVHSLTVPTTIVWGSEDNVVPIRTGHLLHGLLPRNAFQVLEGADHVPMRTHTDAFVRLLKEAFAQPPHSVGGNRRQAPVEDRECYNQKNVEISGHFDEIRLSHCPGAQLRDVWANQIQINNSHDVSLRHVKIATETEAPGLDLLNSEVEATDLRVEGEPAIRLDGGQLDLAGGILRSSQAAFVNRAESLVVVSVTRIESGIEEGYLHGALVAPEGPLDDSPRLNSARRPR